MKTGTELIGEIDAARPAPGRLAFWWLGQMGFAVKSGGMVLYLDPFLSPMESRSVPPLLKPEEIVNADYIFGTHDHVDHIDRGVWKRLSLSSPRAKFVVPQLLKNELSESLGIPEERFVGLSDGLSFTKGGLKATGVAAAHELLNRDPATGLYPCLGYAVESGGTVLFHAGDTCSYEGYLTKLRSFGHLDVLFLPINGRDAKRLRSGCIGNMTYQEAVDLAGALRPGLAVPGHYEMFAGNGEDPALFADYLDAKYPGVQCWIGRHGEMVTA